MNKSGGSIAENLLHCYQEFQYWELRPKVQVSTLQRHYCVLSGKDRLLDKGQPLDVICFTVDEVIGIQ